MINTNNLMSSDQIDKITPALVKAWAEIESAVKDSTNPAFRSKYADLPSVMDAIKPSLKKYDLMLLQPVGNSEQSNQITITTMLVHASGQWISSTLTMNVTQNTPQATGSAITYGRRYAASSLLGVIADEDDDGNDASRLNKAQVQTATPTPRKQTVTSDNKVQAAPAAKLDPVAACTALASKIASKTGVTSDQVREYVKATFTATTPEAWLKILNELDALVDTGFDLKAEAANIAAKATA